MGICPECDAVVHVQLAFFMTDKPLLMVSFRHKALAFQFNEDKHIDLNINGIVPM